MVIESWAGKTPKEIALTLECHPKTVRTHLRRFNAQGIEGLGMRAGSGRKPRLTEQEREPRFSDWSNSRHPDGWRGARMAHWSREMSRDQPSGVWMPSRKPPKKRASESNAVRSGASSCVKECAGAIRTVGGPATSRSSSQKNGGRPTHYTEPPEGSTTVCTDELGPVTPRTFPPAAFLVSEWPSHQSTPGV
jgi:Winged helix-turn helix